MKAYSSISMPGLCPICWEDNRSDSDTVAHSGSQETHPVHKDCIKRWLQKYDFCPICYKKVDPDSVFSWSERCVRQMKRIATNMLGCQVVDSNAAALSALEAIEAEHGGHT